MRQSQTHGGSVALLYSLSFAAVATRAYVLAVGLCATLLLGFPEESKRPTPSSPNPVLDLPLRWDAEWYVGLARGGYRWDGEPGVLENIAFFPAYPLALRAVAWVTGAADSAVQWYWTGVILSTLFLGAALWFLSQLGDLLLGPSTGHRAALLCVVYPWSIYFGLPYTESLFLLACCAATYRFVSGRHSEAFVWALVAGLTRPNGILLSMLFGMLWLRDAYRWSREYRRSTKGTILRADDASLHADGPSLRTEGTTPRTEGAIQRTEGTTFAFARSAPARLAEALRRRLVVPGDNYSSTALRDDAAPNIYAGAADWRMLVRRAVPICGPILGIALYSAYVHGVTGDPLTWLSAQEAWGRPAMDPVWVLSRFAMDMIASPIAMAQDRPYIVANGVTGLAALALVVPVGRRLGWAFAAFVLLGVVMPVAGGGLTSLGRYTAILFPVFIYLAHAAPKPVFVGLVSLSLVAQGLISALFFTWHPVY